MRILNQYLKEFFYIRWYILSILAVLSLSYSVYLYLNADTVARLGSEDNLFEWLTAIAFLLSSGLFLFIFFRARKNLFYLIFSFTLFIGFGEEISWGQRVIGFDTPEKMKQANVQNEFNIHNIEALNTKDMEGVSKKGIGRLFEVNFMFKVFTIFIGALLPFAVFHNRKVSTAAKYMKIPVPPLSLTIFFSVNWLVFKIILDIFLPTGKLFQYYDTDTEIFEFISACIILVISLFFYNYRKKLIPGKDIKQLIYFMPDATVNVTAHHRRTDQHQIEQPQISYSEK